jgi:hypothetical protein
MMLWPGCRGNRTGRCGSWPHYRLHLQALLSSQIFASCAGTIDNNKTGRFLMISIDPWLQVVRLAGSPLMAVQALADEHDHHSMLHLDHFGSEPIGVMAAHGHGRNDWMISWHGNRDGSSRMSTADVFAAAYRIAPESMTMDMHMPGAMYGFSDHLAVMLLLTGWISRSTT